MVGFWWFSGLSILSLILRESKLKSNFRTQSRGTGPSSAGLRAEIEPSPKGFGPAGLGLNSVVIPGRVEACSGIGPSPAGLRPIFVFNLGPSED